MTNTGDGAPQRERTTIRLADAEGLERSSVLLLDETKKQGKAMEAHDIARLTMAKTILAALALLTVLTLAAIIFAPETRVTHVMEFFSFVKSAVPPLVTLVAGFYFGQSNRND
ncbi:hypothetical protein LYZ86_01645 [Xanthomonas hortorum pv. cynarae]|uniref:hypothetical protein n=1 Tax=Xanthomonas hortorum TaxID=56454 RepID=UPI0011B09DA9|nr:hypothetical protein [Xanthomonas hortorum]MCE4347989.1 hypothetical protein [Xanthomonas hortorum pv. cynarae]